LTTPEEETEKIEELVTGDTELASLAEAQAKEEVAA